MGRQSVAGMPMPQKCEGFQGPPSRTCYQKALTLFQQEVEPGELLALVFAELTHPGPHHSPFLTHVGRQGGSGKNEEGHVL